MFRISLLCGMLGLAMAADPVILARWQAGSGVTAAIPAAVATPEADALYEGMPASTGTVAARFAFADPMVGTIAVAPASRFRLLREGDDLILDLHAGIVEVQLDDRGGYAHLRVRSARSETTVVGTLFVVERVSDEQDFVAVVHGRVQVSFRQQVGEALAEDRRSVDLVARQGVAAAAGGLGQPVALRHRPMVSAASPPDGGSAVAAASAEDDPDGSSWSEDSSGPLLPSARRRFRPEHDGDLGINGRLRDSFRRQVLDSRRSTQPGRLPGTPPAPPPQ